MFRFILSTLGGLFSALTLGALMTALGVGAVFWIYGRDLPSHESLAQYTPPTISRIYSGEGRIIDEFAEERRIFAPIADIPPLVQNAFVSAEDKNFWTHKGYDPRGMIAAGVQALEGRRLRGASTITQQVMKNFLLSSDRSAETQDQGTDPGLAAGTVAVQGQDPGTLPQRDLPGAELVRRGGGGADLFQQDAGRAGPGRGGDAGLAAAGAVRLSPGARQKAPDRAARLCPARDVAERLYRPGRLPRVGRRAAEIGAERRLRTVPRATSAARLFHRRDPPPAFPRLRRR